MLQKYVNYLHKVDTSAELLLKRYTDLVSLSNTRPRNEEESEDAGEVELVQKTTQKGLNINMIAALSLSIESNAANIVRLLEELLMVTKALKENWLLNRLPNAVGELQEHYDEKSIEEYERQNENLEGMVEELMLRIVDVDYI